MTDVIIKSELSSMSVDDVMSTTWSEDKKSDVIWYTNEKGKLKIDTIRTVMHIMTRLFQFYCGDLVPLLYFSLHIYIFRARNLMTIL